MHTSFTSSDIHFRESIHIRATVDIVWEYLTDVGSWPRWDTELVSAQLDGNFRRGASGKMVPKSGPNLSFELTKVVEGRSYVVVTPLYFGAIEMKRSVDSSKEGTVFTDDIRFTGPLGWLYGRVLGRGFRGVLPEVMQNFKRQTEARV